MNKIKGLKAIFRIQTFAQYCMRIRFLALLVLTTFSTEAQNITHPENNLAFLQDEVAEVRITIAPNDLTTLLGDSLHSDYHFPATFYYSSSTYSDTIQNVGFRVRGNTSRNSGKKHFKVSFNEYVLGQKFNGIEKMNLVGQHNDPSLLRYWLSLTILTQNGSIAARKSFVKLYINGSYRGLYLNVEHIDDEFLQKRFGDDDQGNLYKCSWGADLRFKGATPSSYYGQYELKTNTDSNDYSAFISFVDSLNNAVNADFPCFIERNFEVDLFLKTLAVEYIIGHWDGYAYNKNNYYLYRRPSSGKYVFIEYDMDNTFGIDWFGIDWSQRNINSWNKNNRPLVQRILGVPYFKDVFNAYVDSVLNELNSSDWYTNLQQEQSLISPFVQNDTYYNASYGFQHSDFLAAIDDDYGAHVKKGVAEYLNDRITSASSQIQILGNQDHPCGEIVDEPDEPQEPQREVILIMDFLGRETEFRTDIPLIFIYDDGSVEKIFTFKT